MLIMYYTEDFEYTLNDVSETIRTKYTPTSFDSLCVNKSKIHIVKNIISNPYFALLLHGEHDTGKTTLIHLILKEYYNDHFKEKYVFHVNGLRDYNYSTFKIAIETFCKSAYSSKYPYTIVVDDMDLINEQHQYILKFCMETYTSSLNFVFSCSNKNKIIKSILYKVYLVQLCKYDIALLKSYLNYVKNDLKITFINDEECNDLLLMNSRYSIRCLLSMVEKLYFIRQNTYTLCDLQLICSTIDDNILEEYTNYVIDLDLKEANNIWDKLIHYGYNVIDILEAYFSFIKHYKKCNTEIFRLYCIKLISKYISIYHTHHENNIELYLFTYELVQQLEK